MEEGNSQRSNFEPFKSSCKTVSHFLLSLPQRFGLPRWSSRASSGPVGTVSPQCTEGPRRPRGSNRKCGSDERSNVEFSLELPGMKAPKDTLLQARDFQGEL